MKLSRLFFEKKQDSTSLIFENETDNSTLKEPLGINLKENLKKVQQTLGNSSDIIFRVFQAGKSQNTPIGIIYTEGLVDINFINSFILETLRTNTALLRRRIKDPNLWIETIIIGKRTKTDVAIAYIKGLASDKLKSGDPISPLLSLSLASIM